MAVGAIYLSPGSRFWRVHLVGRLRSAPSSCSWPTGSGRKVVSVAGNRPEMAFLQVDSSLPFLSLNFDECFSLSNCTVSCTQVHKAHLFFYVHCIFDSSWKSVATDCFESVLFFSPFRQVLFFVKLYLLLYTVLFFLLSLYFRFIKQNITWIYCFVSDYILHYIKRFLLSVANLYCTPSSVTKRPHTAILDMTLAQTSIDSKVIDDIFQWKLQVLWSIV